MKKILMLVCLIGSVLVGADATYVGDKSCMECHDKEFKEWQGSHHDLAMQVVNEKSVLGDFNDATFTSKGGTVSTFFKKDDKFMIRTDGEDGKLHNYEVSYVFGVYPLQQYMIKFPKGKIQVLDIAWDSRSKKDGGQRWYHLHPHFDIKSTDVLHWTGPNMNWNFMCAECHSTNLKKNYDPVKKEFNTTYDVINVSCEACHGPASKHLAWSKTDMKNKNIGLDFSFKGDTSLKGDPKHKEVEVCAKCHSRRSPLDDNYKPGNKFADHFENVLLSDTLYFSDGKSKDEVYVYNSFLQSKMYKAGVVCSDCHNPHTLNRKAEGEKVCYQCHEPKKYTTNEHHKHKVGTTGSDCITCHMPARPYMGVDYRNDHGFRLPRPDLSVDTDIPNACNNCHTDKDAKWSTDAMKKWYGEIPIGHQNFSHVLDSLHKNDTNAQKYLFEILGSDAPNIAKAAAIGFMGNYQSKQSYTTLLQMLRNDDTDIRLNALRAFESFPLKYRLAKTFELLKDEKKVVRIEAARQLSSIPQGDLDPIRKSTLNAAIKEYKDTLIFNADRVETQNALALLYMNQGEFDKAEIAYKEAMRIEPMFVPTYINYAYYYQGKKQENMAWDMIQKGLKLVPNNADLHHAIGLWFIRAGQNDNALKSLKKAAKLSLDNARYQYVYAVAIASSDIKKAIQILEKSLSKHSGDMQTLYGLVYYYNQLGNTDKAGYYKVQIKKIEDFVPAM